MRRGRFGDAHSVAGSAAGLSHHAGGGIDIGGEVMRSRPAHAIVAFALQ